MKMLFSLSIGFLLIRLFQQSLGASELINTRTRRSDPIGRVETDAGNQDFIVPIGINSTDPNRTEVLCTGIVLNSTTVLSTASCVTAIHSSNLEIRVKHPNKDEKVVYTVKEIKFFNNSRSHADLKTDNNSGYSLAAMPLVGGPEDPDSITSAPLSNLIDLNTNGSTCSLVGFNSTSFLKKYNVSIIDWEQCSMHYNIDRSYDADLVCGVVKDAENVCISEAGGAPLICEGRVIALGEHVGIGENCTSMPYVFVKLADESSSENIGGASEDRDSLTRIRSVENSEGLNATVDESVSTGVNLPKANDSLGEGSISALGLNSTYLNRSESRQGDEGPQLIISNTTDQEPVKKGSESNIPQTQERAADIDGSVSSNDTVKLPKAMLEETKTNITNQPDDKELMSEKFSKLNTKNSSLKLYSQNARDERGCAKSNSVSIFNGLFHVYIAVVTLMFPALFN